MKYDYDLKITPEDRSRLIAVSKSGTESVSKIQRAKFILMFIDRNSRKDIALRYGVTEATVRKCINKAKSFGVIAALSDLSRSGRNSLITEEAKYGWLIFLVKNQLILVFLMNYGQLIYLQNMQETIV